MMSKQPKILVADDHAPIRNATQHILTRSGYAVRLAKDGGEALQLAAAWQPDLILLDINMPVADGYEVLRRLKADMALASIYVLVVSGEHRDTDSKVRGLEAGADGYLLRPITNRELVAHVQAGLRTKEAEDALHRQEAQLRQLLANNVDGMLVLDKAGYVLFTNPAACAMFNRSSELLTGYPLGVPVSAAEHADLDLLQPDGNQRIVEMRVSEIEWEGQPALLATLRDTTERRQAEKEIRALNIDLEQRVAERTQELERINQELEAFSYSVSHDLRAPLRAIRGWGQALLEDYGHLLGEEGQAMIQRQQAASQRMNGLIDDLLRLSQLTRQPLSRQWLNLADIVQQVWQELDTDGKVAQATLSIGALTPCRADLALLKQVFVNLMSNALKFSAQVEQPHIEVGQQKTADTNIAYFVRDNGVGFDMRYVDKVFYPFQRLHNQHEFPGTGIGLTIVQRVIHRHGGRVWAEGHIGQGATFYFTLPND